MNIINQNKETIKNLCETHNVEKLYLLVLQTTLSLMKKSDYDFSKI
jgi:hypothetical protein